MKLNPQQLEAVRHTQGPLLIIAGAGTGKTTVITERIKFLIEEKKVNPEHIFAATFTNKAANEMLGRLDQVMPLGYIEPWLGTFHHLTDQLLRHEGLEIGLNPNFTILSQTDQWLFIQENITHLSLNYYRPLGNPSKFISSLITFFSRLQDEDVTPLEFKALLSKIQPGNSEADQVELQRLTELSQAYEKYSQLKRDHAVMDYGDLITFAIKLLRERPNLKRKYQQYFAHILVDEFQDTNYAQFELIQLLAPPSSTCPLTVVADDDQSIYKFRGASFANILEFKDHYPQAKEVFLTQNYRSTQDILDASYAVIINNNPNRLEVKLNIPKKLIATLHTKHTPQILKFETIDDEINWTINQIVTLVTKNITYQDIAILTRSNSQLEPYASLLKSYGLPYQLIANHGLFDQDEVKALIHFLYTLTDPTHTLHLFPLTQLPIFKINPQLVLEALSDAKRNGTTLWDRFSQSQDSEVKAFIDSLKSYQELLTKRSVGQLLYQFVLDSGYVNQFLETESVENQLKIKNLNLFFNKIKHFETVNPDKSALSFLNALDRWLEAGENPSQAQIEDIDTVKLMTAHAAKGLEFKTVFVGSLVNGRFPSHNRKDPIEIPDALIKENIPDGNFHLQEERRLFYVACTRAKEHLFLTYALDLGGAKKWKASGFLQETGLKVETVTSPKPLLPLLPTTKPPLMQVIQGGHYQIKQLSYSKIDTFKVCPLKFKYRYLLQIPAPPHHSLSFGRTLHTTLFLFHQQEMAGKKTTQPELLQIYQDNFIEEGYNSPQHKQDRFQAGKEALTIYYENYRQLFGTPIFLEKEFILKINGIIFNGKIDRIDQNGDQYEIIDYKTGTPKDQKTADKSLQLSIYALAAKEAFNLTIDKLSLYYLEGEGLKFTSTRTEAQLRKAHAKLKDDIQKIQTSDFPPSPSPYNCTFCEYRHLCPFAAQKSA